MLKTIAGLFVFLVLSACTVEEDASVTKPAPEMVGAWIENLPQQSSSGPQDVCDNLGVNKGAVSTDLFKIDNFGNVFDGNEMKDNNQPYRSLGTIDTSGNVKVNDVGRKAFLGNFADITGLKVQPIILATYSLDPFKGELLKLKVDIQFISQGQTSTQEHEKREFIKITDAQEKALITKAQQCLEKTKKQP